MELDDRSGPQQALASAFAVLAAPLGQTLERLSTALAQLLPHRALAVLTGDCARSPLSTHGETALIEKITSAELAQLAGTINAGTPRFGQALLAGTARRVLAVASAPTGATGALLAIVPAGHATPSEPTVRLVQLMWDLVTLRLAHFASAAHPAPLAVSRAAASERARAIDELTDAHATTLAALLGALRSRVLDDATARRNATDIAVSALIELRAVGDRDRALSEETAGDAFARLSDRLSPLIRYSDIALELISPEQAQRSLPADIANTARAVAGSAVLAMLGQDGVGRIRVAWQLEDAELRIVLRDDGPGALAPEALALHRLTDRLAALGGTLTLDATPAWGTTITATLPLAPPDTLKPGPLTALHPRELEVLEQLTRGHRNRKIAEHLHISEHTVKFHVANILNKLGVGSRGEAAAIARSAALTPGPVSAVS